MLMLILFATMERRAQSYPIHLKYQESYGKSVTLVCKKAIGANFLVLNSSSLFSLSKARSSM